MRVAFTHASQSFVPFCNMCVMKRWWEWVRANVRVSARIVLIYMYIHIYTYMLYLFVGPPDVLKESWLKPSKFESEAVERR